MGESGNRGSFVWYDLMTIDPEAAQSFYTELFGWDLHEPLDMGDAGVYQLSGRGEMPLGGMFDKPAEVPGPPIWLYCVSVPDVGAAVQKGTELGGQVVYGPMEVPGGDLIAQCLDPQGAFFALHSKAG